MGRKFNLIQESDKLLRLARQGAPKTRANRRREMRQFINDLVTLGMAPTSLTRVNTRHIEAAVDYWRQQTLSPRTICNKLGIIRTCYKLAALDVQIPSNKTLGLTSSPGISKTNAETLSLDQLESTLKHVEHSFTRSILAFQLYFGLTKTESIRINVNYAKHHGQLLVDRALATNGKDRYIPILNVQQEQALKARQRLLGEKATLTNIITEPQLIALYKADLLIKGFDPQFAYRHYYAQQRLQVLSGHLTQEKIYQQLQAELGITSKHRLMALL